MSEFGDMLKSLRVEKKISQRKLAELVGIDFTYISKIECGTEAPPAESTIINIAKYLGEDSDKMLLAAKKIPSDFQKIIMENKDVQIFLHKAPNITASQWEMIRLIINEKDGKNRKETP